MGRRGCGRGTATAARRAASALLPSSSLFSSSSKSASKPPPPLAAATPPPPPAPPREISDLSSPGLVRSGRGRAKGFTVAAAAAPAALAALVRSAESSGETSPASTSPLRIVSVDLLRFRFRSRSWLWLWCSSPEGREEEEGAAAAAAAPVADVVSTFLGGTKALEGGADVLFAAADAAAAFAAAASGLGGSGGSSSRASKAPGRRGGGGAGRGGGLFFVFFFRSIFFRAIEVSENCFCVLFPVSLVHSALSYFGPSASCSLPEGWGGGRAKKASSLSWGSILRACFSLFSFCSADSLVGEVGSSSAQNFISEKEQNQRSKKGKRKKPILRP